MKLESNDTIVAVSTPPGENGIGIVRLSGPGSLEIADAIFISKDKKLPSEFKSHTVHLGSIIDNGSMVDEVLLTIMRKPKTYTREDIVEINCHGGVVVVRKILDLAVSKGARIAEPGEFTKGAFLNGRIDLTQAESVLDIIRSRTEDSLKVAQRQLSGETSKRIKDIRQKLIHILAEVEVDINFPDEELDAAKTYPALSLLHNAENELFELINSSDKGLILREGVTTVICGKPNVGKSSLMNTFLKQDRVIVTPIPGTTRDAIEEVVNVKGIPLKIVDTAGIIQTEDELTKEDLDIIDIIKEKKTIVVVNKTDLPEALQINEIKNHLHNKKTIRISVKAKTGLQELEDAIYDMFWSGNISADNIFISNSRHIEAARKALAFIRQAINGIENQASPEIVSIDIKDAAEALGIITGDVFTEELLDTIFSRFCIGK